MSEYREIVLKDLNFEDLGFLESEIRGWVTPTYSLHHFIPWLPRAHRASLALWNAIGMLLLPVAVGLAIWRWHWPWLLLILAGLAVLKSNQTTLRQFFLEALVSDREFFSVVQRTPVAEHTAILVED